MLPAIPGLHPQRTTVVVRREKRGQCQTRTLFGAQPRSERTEKARSAHGFIVRWAVHPRARSGIGNNLQTNSAAPPGTAMAGCHN
jgi:hypothetical protein